MAPFRLSSRVLAAPPNSVPVRDAPAVAVPWRVVARSPTGVIEIEHRGGSPLRAVRVTLAGGGLLGLSLPRTVRPGERLRIVLRGAGPEGAIAEPDAMLVLRWFQADGTELLWPIAL